MRPILREPELEASLRDVGYVVVPLLDDAELAALRDRFDRLAPDDGFAPDGTGMNRTEQHCTFLDSNVAYKADAQALIESTFAAGIERYLADYEVLTSNFYVKPGGGRGFFPIHQNWPTVLDLTVTTITVWCPLQDVTHENGALNVVPRSHKLLPDIANPSLPSFFASFEKELIERYMVPIDLRAGEALIFDDSLLHWSNDNVTEAPRVAVQIETLPRELDPVLYHLDQTGPAPRWEVYHVDGRFFIDHSIDKIYFRPPGLELIEERPYTNVELSVGEFDDLLRRGDEIRARVYRGDGWPEVATATGGP